MQSHLKKGRIALWKDESIWKGVHCHGSLVKEEPPRRPVARPLRAFWLRAPCIIRLWVWAFPLPCISVLVPFTRSFLLRFGCFKLISPDAATYPICLNSTFQILSYKKKLIKIWLSLKVHYRKERANHENSSFLVLNAIPSHSEWVGWLSQLYIHLQPGLMWVSP